MVPGGQGDGAVPLSWEPSVHCVVGVRLLLLWDILPDHLLPAPLYFQVIDGVSAAMNGVRNLPLILAVTVSRFPCGAYISVTGIAAPILVFGGGWQALGGRIGKSPLDMLRQVRRGTSAVGRQGGGF